MNTQSQDPGAVGTKYGRWEIIDSGKPYVWNGEKYRTVICRCACTSHTVKTVRLDHLLLGTSQSCGCLRSKNLSEAAYRNKPWEYHKQRKPLQYSDMGNYYVGTTGNGDLFYVDKDDYPLIKQVCWCKHNCGRLCGRYKGKLVFMTDILLQVHHGYDYAFSTKNKLDYRKTNFTIKEIPKGVYFNKNHGKWHVRVTVNKKRKTVGYYDNVKLAVKALIIAKEAVNNE